MSSLPVVMRLLQWKRAAPPAGRKRRFGRAFAGRTLTRIAEAAEPHRAGQFVREAMKSVIASGNVAPADLIAIAVENILSRISVAAVAVPTRTGSTARQLARLRLPVWITAAASREETCQGLQFSYGIHPEKLEAAPADWRGWAKGWVAEKGVPGDYLILYEGPSPDHPDVAQRIEVVDLRPAPTGPISRRLR